MKYASIPYGANIKTSINHDTESPVSANITPIVANAHSIPYGRLPRLHAKNMQNAARYSGIKLKGRYAVNTHITTASAVHTAAVVSFTV